MPFLLPPVWAGGFRAQGRAGGDQLLHDGQEGQALTLALPL